MDKIDNINKYMEKYGDGHDSGMMTSLWAPCLWKSIFFVCSNYPVSPTEDQKKNYKSWLLLLGSVMPCKYCRENFQNHMKDAKLQLTDKIMDNRYTLMKWAFEFKKAVCEAVGTIYLLTFDQFVEDMESYRARCVENENGCSMSTEAKVNAYEHYNRPECPFIPYETAIKFKKYAIERGLDNKYFDYIEACKNAEHNNEIWLNRTKICCQRIKNIKENGLYNVEQDGIYKGLPTIQELKLLMMLSTTLCKKNIEEIINKLTEMNWIGFNV